MLEKRLE